MLGPAIPLALVVVPAYVIACKSEEQVFEENPALYILAFGLVVAKVTNRLVVSFFSCLNETYSNSSFNHCNEYCLRITQRLPYIFFRVNNFSRVLCLLFQEFVSVIFDYHIFLEGLGPFFEIRENFFVSFVDLSANLRGSSESHKQRFLDFFS